MRSGISLLGVRILLKQECMNKKDPLRPAKVASVKKDYEIVKKMAEKQGVAMPDSFTGLVIESHLPELVQKIHVIISSETLGSGNSIDS